MSSPTPNPISNPGVIKMLIGAGFGLMTLFIGGIVAIVLTDHDPSVLINFILGFINLLGLGGIGGTMLHMTGRLKVVEQNTNHTLDKLTDAVIAAPSQQTGSSDGAA